MTVNRIELDFFRNYPHLSVAFHPGVNLIYGDNAQGKTNLLEAIAYLSTAKSHRARYDREMIMLGVDSAYIKGEIHARNRDFTVEARLARGARRQLTANGVRLKTAGELGTMLQTVMFCPEDLYLIREGGAARRKFLDFAICQLRPRYAQALEEYHKLHEHKTRILRDWPEHPSMLDTLDDFNLRMAQMGAIVIHYRAHFIKRLAQTAPSVHREFSGGREEMTIRYETVSTVTDPLVGTKVILQQLLEHQQSHRQAELDSRLCLSGPHKDDMFVALNDICAKTYGSQGQIRTASLSLKLAQRELFYDDTGAYPVLLLDDVLSELDPQRQAFVLNRITSGQVFITCCEAEKLHGLNEGASFHIRDGALVTTA